MKVSQKPIAENTLLTLLRSNPNYKFASMGKSNFYSTTSYMLGPTIQIKKKKTLMLATRKRKGEEIPFLL